MLEKLKREVCRLHMQLPRYNLVVWTGGNISARDPKTGLVVIKPSGVLFEDLKPHHHVVSDLDGNIVEGKLKPSSDLASHLYVYRHRPDVNGVVHTHSTYATAFAALGRPIPCFLTGMADEFGGPIPCAGFALIGSEAIGRQIIDHIGSSRAVLLQNHGVFTIGPTVASAVKTAVMTEDVARTSFMALQLGRPLPIPKKDIEKLHYRYQNVYGQR